MSIRSSKRILAVTLALLAASQLAACGGGGGGGGSTPPVNNAPPGGNGGNNNPPAGGGDNNPAPGGGDTGGGNPGGGDNGGGSTPPGELTSGTFVDAPVAGLSYTTSSELTGVTDADGRYNYRAGDTVTFSIGNLVLGTVPGQGVVTPMTVANALVANTSSNPETVAVNLLVLLQSLDSNGNPDDGISFTPEIRNAIAANSINLTADETAFTSSLSSFVSSVSGASGVSLTTVNRNDAISHFVGQAPGALAGLYVRADANFAPITQKAVTLTLFRSGRYLLGGQYDNTACNLGDSEGTPVNPRVFSDANGNGVEYGQYTWDPLTNEFAVSNVTMETDGFCGFNEPITGATNDTTELEITVDGLVFRDSEGNVAERFVRLDSARTGIAATWVQPTALMKGQPLLFSMFPSSEDGKTGRYLMLDASAPSVPNNTSPGIEEGCYSIDADDNLTVELNSAVCPNAIDTNDTAGLSDSSGVQMRVDAYDRLVVTEGLDVTGFARLPVEQLTHEKLAGAWMIESEPGIVLGEQPGLAMLTVFEDGRFVFGSQENDASCVATYPTPDQDEDGNGVEYGTLSLTDVRGLVTPHTTVDTNGECGLFDVNRTGPQTQRYFIVPNAASDALVLWANDEEDPAGIVLKRVPSVDNEITGAWLWSEGVEDEFAVVAYLPGGVMFEVSLFPGATGLLRESFTMEGDVMTSQAGGYEYCVDTENDPAQSNCLDDTPIVESYPVQGDSIGDPDEPGSMTRIPSP